MYIISLNYLPSRPPSLCTVPLFSFLPHFSTFILQVILLIFTPISTLISLLPSFTSSTFLNSFSSYIHCTYPPHLNLLICILVTKSSSTQSIITFLYISYTGTNIVLSTSPILLNLVLPQSHFQTSPLVNKWSYKVLSLFFFLFQLFVVNLVIDFYFLLKFVFYSCYTNKAWKSP